MGKRGSAGNTKFDQSRDDELLGAEMVERRKTGEKTPVKRSQSGERVLLGGGGIAARGIKVERDQFSCGG